MLKSQDKLRGLPVVTDAPAKIEGSGFAKVVFRMLVFLGNCRGDIRADRLQRASDLVFKDAPFADLAIEMRI